MKTRRLLAAVIVAAAMCSGPRAWSADLTDRPRPGVWRRHPKLKKALDADLARMRKWLARLEPQAFEVKYGRLAAQARSKDAQQRGRALAAIATLREDQSLPILVAAMEGEWSRAQPAQELAGWIYTEYSVSGGTPPRHLKPLLPLFIRTLVEAQDEPNLRAYCFQAIGCLADSKWRPVMAELAPSRHPAVTHWAKWALGQIASRAGCTPARAVQVHFKPACPPAETTYSLTADELADVRRRVIEVLASSPTVTPDPHVRYSTGLSHFDSWVPIPARPQKDPPDGFHYRWHFLNGRVTKVALVKYGKSHLQHTLRYSNAGAPVLCVNHAGTGISRLVLADYDARGLLCRTVFLSKALEPVRVDVFENEDGYASTTHWSFTGQGKFRSRTRDVGNDLLYLDTHDPRERRVNSGARLWWLRMLERHHLASVYPIPEGHKTRPREVVDRQKRPPPTYDPDAMRLRIVRLTVNPAAVEDQCTGTLVIRNVGPDYPAPPANVIGPSYEMRIFDSKDRLIFRAGGAWGGGMKTGQQHIFRFDTRSNTLPCAQGRTFVFPTVGRYRLTIVLKPGSEKILHSRTVSFDVGFSRTTRVGAGPEGRKMLAGPMRARSPGHKRRSPRGAKESLGSSPDAHLSPLRGSELIPCRPGAYAPG